MRIVDARFFRATTKRDGQDRLVVIVDRGLKSGKYDEAEMTPEAARTLATRLLIAAERAEGKIRSW